MATDKALRDLLGTDSSAATTDSVVRYVLENPDAFTVLVGSMLHAAPPITQRAAWAIGKLGEIAPHMATAWLPVFLDALDRPHHDAVHRCVMRILQFCPLPATLEGRVLDTALRWISDPTKAIAPRAFAITVAERAVARYPELAPEWVSTLELLLQGNPSAGLRSRATKALETHRKRARTPR